MSSNYGEAAAANVKRSYTPTPWRRKPSLTVFSGLSELARGIGVAGPATVSNWRSRLQGFPSPKAGGKFDLVEVVEWMRDHGPRSTDVRDIRVDSVWPFFAAAYQDSADAPPPAARATMVALVLLRHATSELEVRTEGGLDWQGLVNTVLQPNHADAPLWVPFADYLRLLAGDLEAADQRLRGLLVEQLTVRDGDALHLMDLVDLLDTAHPKHTWRALEAVLRLDPERSLSTRSSGRRLATLAVALARLQPGHTLLDPAAGEGTVLTRAWSAVGQSVRLVGQENDPAVWTTLRSRLLIEGVVADLGERAADSLRDDQHASVRADAVVIDPPLGETAPALDRWIEYGLSHLAQGGRLVMVLPMHEFVPVRSVRRRPPERMKNMFNRMLAAGLVEGILVVPSRLRSDIVGPSLMVVMRPGSGDSVQIVSGRPEVTSLWSGQELSAMAEAVRTMGLAHAGTAVPGLELAPTPLHRVSTVLEQIAAARSRPDRSDETARRKPGLELDELRSTRWAVAAPLLIEAADAVGSVERASPLDELTQRLEAVSRDSAAQGRELAQLRHRHTMLRAAIEQLLSQFEHHRSGIDPDIYRHLSYDVDRVRDELR